jgi:hypothetical protein
VRQAKLSSLGFEDNQSALRRTTSFHFAVGPESQQTLAIRSWRGDEHERFGNSNIRTAFGLDVGRFVDGVSITATSV